LLELVFVLQRLEARTDKATLRKCVTWAFP
jgi:hypothetical protein